MTSIAPQRPQVTPPSPSGPQPPLPTASPLPARKRRPILWISGALIVIVCMLAGAALLGAVTNTEPYLAVARPVPAGTQISDDDLVVVEINRASGLAPIPATERESVVGSYATTGLLPGTLLTKEHVTEQWGPGPGRHLVSVGLKPEVQPARQLVPGDQVLLVAIADPRAGGQESGPPKAPETYAATVFRVSAPAPNGDIVVDVDTAAANGPTVAALAAAGRLVIVLTSGS